MDADPPFHKAYENLFDKTTKNIPQEDLLNKNDNKLFIVEECELPIIDLSRLNLSELEKEKCKAEIVRASKEWGFFQVVNHEISSKIWEKIRLEQQRMFKQPFDKKIKEDKYLKHSAGSYRWGTPSATNLSQLSWSEAFHIPLVDIYSSSGGFDSTLGTIVQQFVTAVSNLAQKLAEILAEKMGHESTFFQENCLPSTCYLRMNHYPPCPIALDDQVFGLTPHTDSDFLTILHQDQVGGLQLVKDGKWIAVKPNPEALIINIGDLFQAWSNGTYVSVKHRVVTNPVVERFSTAYFFCPAYDTVIQSCCEPAIYKEFSFREYRQQVQADVQKLGSKIGLARFLV
ncbi:gibberellin 2-beta-dioxygenase 8-like [Juglans microcarpa x Juglans regia]|uniref:gibberellin 2-beta-dioxygenase 8-like n=1 Tax=Juglans microcarpa x Juglans regia TaxID=2249226 RepID=UPI001B7E7CDE|nr:gibberellin 2-beta-dioxygenase 8-like [Juglans microcarpa x Juglans regia]XP_041028279.1 gibberellin 2-beta-dioxygenase 8-like [Juglans microcarpa x Juglans regia]XP_041028280.1 gibberellin 2-beta-dioxygenase 8-like [Juglans microcarpa x Juglans regia]XP_041028281.1 gibberellin 2-beta-dioxygenase 8-like [Juglans microcarpa x Juglans regia]XP_041028282.1 gibberellin 2-beta-dioxygenase 8-like [Juglans microcarpa x Juglans regia]XP_041028283.1 gibberellin 2-beta-dioxygenase 8-like [Juglans mic